MSLMQPSRLLDTVIAELAPAFHVSEESSPCIRLDAFFRGVEKITLFLEIFHIK